MLIIAKKIPVPAPEQLVETFLREASGSLTGFLRLEVVDPNNAPPNATINQVVLNAPLSDLQPRVTPGQPIVRSVCLYLAPRVFNTAYFTKFVLNGDNFVTVSFCFPADELAKTRDWSPIWIERLLMAASLSYFD
jgi:hypothetical protein